MYANIGLSELKIINIGFSALNFRRIGYRKVCEYRNIGREIQKYRNIGMKKWQISEYRKPIAPPLRTIPLFSSGIILLFLLYRAKIGRRRGKDGL